MRYTGYPAFSLSIGIAHGDEDDTTDTLFKKQTRFFIKLNKLEDLVLFTKNRTKR